MKQKMSNRKFMAIVIPIMVFLLILVIAVTVACNMFAPVLNNHLGRGEMHREIPEGTEDWDTDYYDRRFETTEEAKEYTLSVNEEVVNEGMVLLKNNGVLPLSKSAAVTPFGRGYAHPIYNGNAAGGSIKYTDPEGEATVSPAEALGAKFTNIVTAAADLQPESTGYKLGMWRPSETGSWYQPVEYTNYPDAPAAAEGTTAHDVAQMGGDNYILELDASVYDSLSDTDLGKMKDSTALVFVTRSGNENADKKSDGYTDGTEHFLQFSKNERDMIAFAKESCKKVVLVVVASNPIELDVVMDGELEADAIIWAGHPGDNGFKSLASILCGDVNPSGRLVDLFATDFLDTPSFKNWGDFYYTNATMWEFSETPPHAAGTKNEDGKDLYYRPYVEYEEGMYNGYRYYETAHDIKAAGFVYGELDENGGVVTPGEVAYPFGYGLSYTDFTSEITAFDKRGDDITVEVTVINDGEKAGKEVVQLYYTAPYTDLDRTMLIEKPTVNLLAFAKTKLIEPHDSATVTITFSVEEMSSYCYTRDNGDGTTGCYMLEEGDYIVSLRANSHDVTDSETWHNPETIWYDNSNPRTLEKDMQSAMADDGTLLDFPARQAEDPDAEFIAATNLFPYMSDYMRDETDMLSCKAWDADFTSEEPARSKEISQKYIDMFGIEQAFDSATNPEMGNVEGSKVYTDVMPKSGAEKTLTVLDMRGKDYYDESWEILLDQIDWDADKDDIIYNFTRSNYFYEGVDSIGLPPSSHCEGANGVRMQNQDDLTTSWCMAPEMASTWNVALMEKMGEAMGQEALTLDLHGRMSPAMNLHRSPFQGRVFEYFSEDPILTGKIAAAIVTGTSGAGMYDFIKHFGLNDQETNRSKTLHTWATEQVVRELYNKPFEICIRDARKTIRYTADADGTVGTKVMRGCSAIMIAQNAFGPVTAFCNYDLVTRLLREEWGFTGLVNGDMYNWPSSKGIHELFMRAGCDTWLAWNTDGTLADYDSATARTVMREALHHIAYTVANSSVLQNSPPGTIIYYDMSPWMIGLIALNVVIYCLIAGGIVWLVFRLIDAKKHPEKYKSKNKAETVTA